MRNYLYLLLFIVFAPAALLGQKKVEKKMAVWPVTVQTKTGTKTIQKPNAEDFKRKAQEAQMRNKNVQRPMPNGRQMDEGGPSNATWTGAVSSDWNDPGNWEEGEAPGYNTSVTINGIYDNEPEVDGNIIISSLSVFNSSNLTINGSLDAYGSLFISDADISGNLAGHYLFSCSIDNSNLQQLTLDNITGGSTYNGVFYPGEFNIIGNYIAGDLFIEDDADGNRAVVIAINNNTIEGSLTVKNHALTELFNGTEDNGIYIANGDSNTWDEIGNGLYITNNSAENRIYVGIGAGNLGEGPWVVGDVDVAVDLTRPYLVEIDKISIGGSNNVNFSIHSTISVGRPMGPVEIPIPSVNELYFSKTDNASLYLNGDLLINNLLYMGQGPATIYSSTGNRLIIGKDCIVQDQDPLYGAFVVGPMTKIGNAAFTFPIGEYQSFDMRAGNLNETSAISKPSSSYGSGKFPLSISAPTETDAEFVAQYRAKTPNYEGYYTNLTDPDVSNVIEDGYWSLQHAKGSSNVAVTLSYYINPTLQIPSKDFLAMTVWDGSKWINIPRGDIIGDDVRGTISSSSSLATYGPLALHTGVSIRKPVMNITEPVEVVSCEGKDLYFTINYTLDTAALTGTKFSVELSEADGTFATYPRILGYVNTDVETGLNISGSITVNYRYWDNTMPTGNYQIRIRGDKQVVISENTIPFYQRTIPQLEVAIIGLDDVCMDGAPFKYYPSDKEPGVTYTWTVTGGTFTSDGDTAYVTFTSKGNQTIKVTPTNQCGNGVQKTLTVNVKPGTPVSTPAMTHTGRWLYASVAPIAEAVTAYNWYRDGVQITGVNSIAYYAKDAGSYTVKYANDCGEGPGSGDIHFDNNSVSQAITFANIPDKAYNDPAFPLPAVSSAGLPVQYRIVSGPGVIADGVYAFTGVGAVVIEAYQQGDDVYDTAVHVTKSFIVNKAPQTIDFPAIQDQVYTGSYIYITLEKNTSGGLPITYQSASPNVYINNNTIRVKELGSVTITATQAGNSNYLAASDATQSFCVMVTELGDISGSQYSCPNQAEAYKINKIPGLTYHWRLADGTTYPATTEQVDITWSASGTHKLYVSATGPCGQETAIDSLEVTIMDAAETPSAVTKMFPNNGTSNVIMPFTLSWVSGGNTTSYDIYVWEEGTARPSTPFVSNLTKINYSVAKNSGLIYGQTYNWQVVSKNGCLTKEGPVQTFTMRVAPDLTVTQVNVPATVNSGQTITIEWKVKNIGAASTLTNEKWNDAVFLSFDEAPNFQIPPEFTAVAWSQAGFPLKPLLVGTKENVASLNAGEEYTNSVDFVVPMSYGQPVYAYVITNYKGGVNAPPDSDYTNDTTRNPTPIDIHMTPTPDLRVETVYAPNSTFSGSTIDVTYKIKNYGALTPPNSGWVDKIYMSQNPIFNNKDAILLKKPKRNGTYYPNAEEALFYTTSQLPENGTVTKTEQVVVPNFIMDTWFIHVVTNENGGLYEGALGDNNENSTGIQVFLTPPPQLQIYSVTPSETTVSPFQDVNLNWSVFNNGAFDNMEKNKGWYGYDIHDFHVWVGNPGDYNSNDTQSSILEKDSLSWGNSSWTNKIYLSTDPNELNKNNAIYIGEKKIGTRYSIPDDIIPGVVHKKHTRFPHGQFNPNKDKVLRPGSVHQGLFNFSLPSNIPAGDYYVYVLANDTKTVFTYPVAEVVGRSGKIKVVYPDLSVVNVEIPTNVQGGMPFEITYQVGNSGLGSLQGRNSKDEIYMSESSVFDNTATLIQSLTGVGSLAAGQSVTQSATITLPYEVSGTKYFFVKVNTDQKIPETNYANNTAVSNATNASYAVQVDLEATEVSTTGNIPAPGSATINYTVKNNSIDAVSGNIKDEVYFGCTTDFGNAFFVGNVSGYRNVNPGESYQGQINVSNYTQMFLRNACFVRADQSAGYIFVVTNANDGVYEAGNKSNNILSKAVVFDNKNVDLIVSDVVGGANGEVGRAYPMTWKVSNVGSIFSGYYHDAVYLSKNPVWDDGAVLAYASNAYFSLSAQASKNYSQTITIPKLDDGDYYVLVVSDYKKMVASEVTRSNNVDFVRDELGNPQKVHITASILSDLQVEILSAPSSVAIGQPITVKYKITNHGAGDVYPLNWNDRAVLSKGTVPDLSGGDKLMGDRLHKNGLAVGVSYTDSVTYTIPEDLPAGNYMLIVNADERNLVVEDNDSNNIALQPIQVFIPAPSDLVVENVAAPDTVFLGYPAENISWTVKNISVNSANGVSTDGIYLSQKTEWDSTAILIGLKKKNKNLAALGTERYSEPYIINNVPEGEYYIIVRADIQNNISETDKTNNDGTTQQKVYVSVKELRLGETLTDATKESRYYRLNIPKSQLGSTVLVTLESDKYLTQWNELYAGGGYIPSVLKSDYKFDNPYSGNQQILLSDITDTVYYIAVMPISKNKEMQQIQLHAQVLPFAIVNVHSNAGGNGGNVTVKLTGSLFFPGMTGKLIKGGDIIEASSVHFVSSTTAYATFPLLGKPIGVYDIVLTKPDESTTMLTSGFSVVSPNNGGLYSGGGVNTGMTGCGGDPGCDPGAPAGKNSQLSIEVMIPDKVFAGWVFPIQINYTNPTNMDIPIQTLIIFNDYDMPMALSKEDLPKAFTQDNADKAKSSLYIELAEKGGVPGIIRAGGSGTITLYSISAVDADAHKIVHFDLK